MTPGGWSATLYPMPSPRRIPSFLHQRAEDVYVLIDIVLDFPDSDLPAVERGWGPERQRLPASAEHRHWDWENKTGQSKYRLVAVMNEESCEGLLSITKRTVPSWKDGRPLVYVAYIESAPWNNDAHPDGARHKGVGAGLMTGAIMLSQESAAKGGVCLHSLDSSRRVYRHWGMMAYGRDMRYEDLTYFEFSADEAAAFLAQRMG